MVNSQEDAGDSSFYTTYSYEYDFINADISEAPSVPFPKRFLESIWSTLKIAILTSAKISWEFSTFIVFYLVFTQKRFVAFAYWLESIKDGTVSVLMWRRGLLFRPTVHGGILSIASIALVVGGLFNNNVIPKDFTRDSVIAAQNTPETLVPQGRPRSEIIKYQVKKGETLSQIAGIFKISTSSIKWANNITNVDKIKPGDVLAIPPVTGITHKVKKRDSLKSVAKTYRANAQTIADYPFNYIDDSLALRAGEILIIPGGKKPDPTPLPSVSVPASKYPVYYAGGSGLFAWPVRGSLNQTASWWHPAIDIGAAYGSSVRAAASGTVRTVSLQGWGFGHHIVIQHNNGYTTTYAHMAAIYVSSKEGSNRVSKGQPIGTVGCTGFCTGSNLHFGVNRSGQYFNPLSLLP